MIWRRLRGNEASSNDCAVGDYSSGGSVWRDKIVQVAHYRHISFIRAARSTRGPAEATVAADVRAGAHDGSSNASSRLEGMNRVRLPP